MKLKPKNLLIVALILSGKCIWAQESSNTDSTSSQNSVFDMSIEDLLNVKVTSVSKKAENLQHAASSIYVLTKEDIQRSGATNFIELLRQVPGFWATQEEYNTGNGNMRYSEADNGQTGSVLYLLDGTPLQELMSSTISFRNFDLPLDEIERIEVIRGSGGTIYGANSATGVVNIFTKDAKNYDSKLSVKAETGSFGYLNGTVRGSSSIGSKLGISAYGKFRQFNGYTPVNGFDGTYVTVPKNNGSGDTTILNRFSQNFQEQLNLSYGLKAVYEFSEKTKLSLNTHFNNLFKKEYTNSFPAEFYGQKDVLYLNNLSTYRITGNIRLDHTFNDKHSLFARISNNAENDFFRLCGGYWTNNSIQDIEIQDNLTKGKHDLSFGANYRYVNIDINRINSPSTINYLNPQNHEKLKGAFVQDKFTIVEDKLKLTAGIKAEQYTLVNNNFYLSPNIKLAYTPTDKLTLWTGFTLSYTTPGLNQTNIDLTLFKAPSSYGFFYNMILPQVTNTVRSQVYQNAINQGADEATANAQADAYINSQSGKDAIATNTDAAANQTLAKYPGYYNKSVKNGSKTVPTKFQTFELGIRSSNVKNTTVETNFYYTIISDGIAPSTGSLITAAPSLTQTGQYADYYTYGNYLKGYSIGNESMIRTKLVKYLTLEGSFTYLTTHLDYQKNSDFDISQISNVERTLTTPMVPHTIWRAKMYLDLPKSFYITASAIFASKYNSDAIYQFQNQRYAPILELNSGVIVAANKSRTICNIKIEKKFNDNRLSVYVFGNDILNSKGIIESTTQVTNVTLSQTKAMYGLGFNYNF